MKRYLNDIRMFLIRMLGGFSSINDALRCIEEMEMRNREKVLTMAVRRLYNTISQDDILRIRADGEWMFMGKVMPEGIRKQVINEASVFLSSKLWQVFKADVKYQANKKTFLHAQDIYQLTAGKLWMYTIDCFKTRVESLAKEKGFFNKVTPT